MAAAPKPRLLLIALLSLAAAILPELLPDTWKDDLKTSFGTHYALVWAVVFLAVSAALFFLTWRESQAEGDGITRNKLDVKGNYNQTVQGTGVKSSTNTATIGGDNNTTQQG